MSGPIDVSGREQSVVTEALRRMEPAAGTLPHADARWLRWLQAGRQRHNHGRSSHAALRAASGGSADLARGHGDTDSWHGVSAGR